MIQNLKNNIPYTFNSNNYNLIKSKSFNPNNLTINLLSRNEKTIFSSVIDCDNKNDLLAYRLEYTEDSTKENPKIKVYGEYSVSKEKYSDVIVLNDVDLTNATAIELSAVRSHISKNDKKFEDLGVFEPVSKGEVFEFGKKYNFLEEFQRDVLIYKQGGYNDSYFRYSKALDKFLDFFEKRK